MATITPSTARTIQVQADATTFAGTLPSWEQTGHEGDDLGFRIWVGCFLLMAALCLGNVLANLFGW